MLTPHCILTHLPATTKHIYIAFSGGKDSHVLLHLASSIATIKARITAVHINHGLQPAATDWERHCQKVALANKVAYRCLSVNAQKQSRQSPEEAARNARYQALRCLLTEADVLLLAQHREDQLETVLLQLFRGAGVQGLAAMPQATAFGKGRLLRPLLDFPQAAINAYAQQHGLHWVEDPSNKNDACDRNFLRNQIVPQLKQRWRALDKTVSRSAQHCASSHWFNTSWAQQTLPAVIAAQNNALSIPQLLALDRSEQQLLIRYWFTTLQLAMPSTQAITTIIDEVIKAKPIGNPVFNTKTYCMRRYRQQLYCLQPASTDLSEHPQRWNKELKQLQFKQGTLTLCAASEGICQARWNAAEVWVKFNQGAATIKLPNRRGHRVLKKLFQEQAIPPWERAGIPLIYLDGVLAAVVGLWVSADFIGTSNDECWQFHWSS